MFYEKNHRAMFKIAIYCLSFEQQSTPKWPSDLLTAQYRYTLSHYTHLIAVRLSPQQQNFFPRTKKGSFRFLVIREKNLQINCAHDSKGHSGSNFGRECV